MMNSFTLTVTGEYSFTFTEAKEFQTEEKYTRFKIKYTLSC